MCVWRREKVANKRPLPSAGVQLVNVRRVHTDETTYQVPAQSEQLEGPVPTSEPASEENMDQMQSGVSAGKVHVYDILYNTCTCSSIQNSTLFIVF